jgi:hypothetical protein
MHLAALSVVRRALRGSLFVGLLTVFASSASATTVITFDGAGYQDGSVTYSISGDQLTITLANTAVYESGDQLDPADALTGVIFALPEGVTLTAVSATVAPGSSIIQADQCDAASCAGVTNVGQEFGYQTAPFASSGVPSGPYNAGIGSSGQIAGNGSQFPGGVNLDKPVQMDGINFALVGENYAVAEPNAGLTKDPLISNAVTFILTINGSLLESDITNWALVFGTSWTEGVITTGTTPVPDITTPEPSSLVLLGGGLTSLAAVLRRRRKSRTARGAGQGSGQPSR